MAFLQVEFYSKALEVASSAYVILPRKNMDIGVTAADDADLPKVLYLLHGCSDDHTIRMRRTSVERYAAKFPLAVVMPAVNHSFCCNEPHGEQYWDYISDELPTVMRRFFRLSNRPEDTFAAGLGMGGYGAMRLGLTYPKRFAAIGSFFGGADVARFAELPEKERIKKERAYVRLIACRVRRWIYSIFWSSTDHVYISLNCTFPAEQMIFCSLHIRRLFRRPFKTAGTHYEKPATGHEWSFWDEQISRFILWIMGEDRK